MSVDWGYRWFLMRLRWIRLKHVFSDRLPFRLAFLMPRAVVYYCFIRLIAATGENPASMTCIEALKAWDRGAGR